MLSSVQQPHKSNHGKSLSHSHQAIKALINLGAAFQNKLRVTVNPFIAQGLLLTSTICTAGKGVRRALPHSRRVQTADAFMTKAEGYQDEMIPCRYGRRGGHDTTLAPC